MPHGPPQPPDRLALFPRAITGDLFRGSATQQVHRTGLCMIAGHLRPQWHTPMAHVVERVRSKEAGPYHHRKDQRIVTAPTPPHLGNEGRSCAVHHGCSRPSRPAVVRKPSGPINGPTSQLKRSHELLLRHVRPPCSSSSSGTSGPMPSSGSDPSSSHFTSRGSLTAGGI